MTVVRLAHAARMRPGSNSRHRQRDEVSRESEQQQRSSGQAMHDFPYESKPGELQPRTGEKMATA
jgi:hypothetical protein